MIPQNYHFMNQLPTLSNGKIDRKTLQETFKGERVEVRFSRAATETERTLLAIWEKLFGYKTLGIEDNYFALGGDSLVATRLISEIQKIFNCKISIGAIFENPTIKALARVIDQTEHEFSSTLEIRPDLVNRYKPFPLTDVQYAYWIGRSGLYELGNVATHCYFELDTEKLDIKKAEKAWNTLIKRHGMMRVIIRPDGTQEILESVPTIRSKFKMYTHWIKQEKIRLYMLKERKCPTRLLIQRTGRCMTWRSQNWERTGKGFISALTTLFLTGGVCSTS